MSGKRGMDEPGDALAVEIMGNADPETALRESLDALVVAFGEAAVITAVKEKFEP